MQKTTNMNAAGQQILDIISKAASKLGISEEEVAEKIENLEQEDQVTVFKALQDFIGDNPSPQTKEIINKVFPKKNTSAFKNGGKIKQFVCKHGRGGGIGCGCIEKAKDGYVVKNGSYSAEKQENGGEISSFRRGKKVTQVNVNNNPSNAFHESTVDEYMPESGLIRSIHSVWPSIGKMPVQDTVIIGGPNGTIIQSPYAPKPISGPGYTQEQNTGAWKRVNNEFDEAEEVPMEQEGGWISRRQARREAMEKKGYNRSQYDYALANAMNIAQSKWGLSGDGARQIARALVTDRLNGDTWYNMYGKPSDGYYNVRWQPARNEWKPTSFIDNPFKGIPGFFRNLFKRDRGVSNVGVNDSSVSDVGVSDVGSTHIKTNRPNYNVNRKIGPKITNINEVLYPVDKLGYYKILSQVLGPKGDERNGLKWVRQGNVDNFILAAARENMPYEDVIEASRAAFAPEILDTAPSTANLFTGVTDEYDKKIYDGLRWKKKNGGKI